MQLALEWRVANLLFSRSSLAADAAQNPGWFCRGLRSPLTRLHLPPSIKLVPQAALSVEACILCFPKALAIAWFFLLNSYLPTFICNYLQVLIKK